jgi:phosphohistidine phosphatase SixA
MSIVQLYSMWQVGSIMRWLFTVFAFVVANLFVVGVHAAQPNQAELIAALKTGGHVLLLRHAQTVPGVGDPPNFKLGDCSTQRNLSDEGRAQSKRIGEALRSEGIRFARTLTSQWCRCRDTANAMSDKVEDFAALNSFFENRSDEAKQSTAVKQKAKSIPKRESWLMVTHQVNITALTAISPAMGEGVVVRVADGAWKPLGAIALDTRR